MKMRMGKIGAIGLVLALSSAAIVPMAFADTIWETGFITVKPAGSTADNPTGDQPAGYQYKLAPIFKAQVDNGKASNLTWTSTAMKSAVEGVIAAWAQDNSETYTGTTEQEAADYINAHMTSPGSYSTILAADSFGEALAKAVDGVAGASTLAPWTKTSADEGWVLVYTDPAAVADEGSATSPIFALIEKTQPATGEYDANADPGVVINEKASVPTASKQVKAAGDNAYAAAADAMIGANEDFLLTGTLPANYASYETYEYTFTDTLSGLEINTSGGSDTAGFDKGDITVKYGTSFDGGTTMPNSAYTATYENDVLTVDFTNLKSVDGIAAGSNIYVAYQAALTNAAQIGASGNLNSCDITYSNDPQSDSTGTTQTTTTSSYTYQIEITKMDRDNQVVIPGVTFSLTKGSDPVYVNGSAGSYTVCAAPANAGAAGAPTNQVITDATGKVTVTGLDAGTYTLTEVDAPEQFTLDTNPFTVTIASAISNGAYDSTETISGGSFGVTVSGGADTDRSAVTAVSAANGKGEITIQNVLKANDMPRTGMAGITGIIIAGVVLIGAGIVVAVRRSRSED